MDVAHGDDEIRGFFAGQLPDEWLVAEPEISGDRDEVLVIGTLPTPKTGDDASEEAVRMAAESRIAKFREETREERMRIAREAEHRFGRKVSWGAACGGVQSRFTTLGVPVMTRLRLAERGVLDTLIDSGVARSRSEALAWCVRLVGEHESNWLSELRDAMRTVEEVRAKGPQSAG